MKDFFPVPRYEFHVWWRLPNLWRPEWPSCVTNQPVRDDRASIDLLRDEDVQIVAQPDGSAVNCFVVERAERDAILSNVRNTCCVPLDVRCFQAKRCVPQPPVVPAYSTSVFVDTKHVGAKRGIASLAPGFRDPGHTDRIKDLFVHRLWKVVDQQLGGELIESHWIGFEQVERIFAEAAMSAVLSENSWRNTTLLRPI